MAQVCPIADEALDEPRWQFPGSSDKMKCTSFLWEDTVADGAGNNFDIVILGGGSGGYACALRAVQLGKSVALIEKSKLGGTCLHWGCIPTKALLHSAEVADLAREGAQFGVKSTFDGIDMVQVNTYKDGVIDRLYKGLQGLIKSGGITVVEGEGKLVDARRRHRRGQRRALHRHQRRPGHRFGVPHARPRDRRPRRHQHRGADDDRGAREGRHHRRQSSSASSSRRSGSPSAPTSRSSRACRRSSRWRTRRSASGLERAFRKRKINFKTGVKFDSVEQTDSGVTVTLENGDTIETDLVLVAVGRGPNSAGMGFEEAGVTVDRGWVPTNERLATNVDGVFAVGDLVPGLQLAHRGFAHGIFVAEEIAGLNPQPVIDSGIPRVTYCEPEIASVGITEPQAREKFGDDSVETVEYNLGGNGKSQILGTAGTRQARPREGRADRRRPHDRLALRRAGRRGVADGQLGGLPRGRRPVHPRPPHPERGARRGRARAGRQAPSLPRLTRRSHMATSVTLPALGESVTEGTVTQWLKQVGDTVAVDEPLLEISTDKVDTEIPSPSPASCWRSRRTRTRPSRSAPSSRSSARRVRAPAATPHRAADEAPAEQPAPAAEPEPAPVAEERSTQPADSAEEQHDAAETAAAPQAETAPAAGGGTEVTLPALGESVTEGTVTQWLKQVGDDVAVDEPLLEISTDKVDTEIPSPVAGKLLEIRAAEDETVEVGAVLAVIGAAGAAPAEPQARTDARARSGTGTSAAPAAGPRAAQGRAAQGCRAPGRCVRADTGPAADPGRARVLRPGSGRGRRDR